MRKSGPTPGTASARHGGILTLRIIGFLSVLSGVVAALLLVVSVGVTCQMIFIRFVLNGSTIWQTEGVTYMMICATMLGLSYIQYLRGHVNVDLLPLMLPDGARKILAYMVLLMTLAVCGVMLWNRYYFWHEAWDWGETSNTPWNPKLWVPYLALPLGFALYTLQLIADTYAMSREIEAPFGINPETSLADALSERSD